MPDITLTSAPVTWQVANLISGATARGANGYVEFEASAVAVHHGGLMWLPSPQRAEMVDGILAPISLPVNDPDIWNWRVSPRLGVRWEPFHINVGEGGTDLSSAAIVPGKGPVRVLQGPKGASVVDFRDTGDGALVLVLDDGTESPPIPFTRGPAGPANEIAIGTVLRGEEPYASLVGEAPHQMLNLVLPKGDRGIKGDRGKGVPEGAPEGLVVAGDGEETAWVSPMSLLPVATEDGDGLMPAADKSTLGTYRVGEANLVAGREAAPAVDPDATRESSGSSGGYFVTFLGAHSGEANERGWNNTAVGSNSMRDNVDGYNNVAVGDSALERNVGGVGGASASAGDPGARNTAVGSYALRYNRTGLGNVGVGRNAAHTNVSGDYNTAVGTNAFSGSYSEGGQQDVKTASYNTAVGYNALFRSNANSSVAVGDHALYAADAAEQTAVGSQAGRGITTGTYNVAVGARALKSQTTGGSNTTVGTAAAENLTTGSRNTAIGTSTMADMTGGGSNTAVGWGAGSSELAPNYTTAVGTSATPIGGNSTAVGYNAATTAANQVQLGNSATTTHVYGTVQNRSDARDKADVRDTILGLDFIESVRPVDYRWDMREDYEDGQRDGSKKRTRFHHGVIAQELRDACTSAGVEFGGLQDHSVNGGEDVLSIGYDELIGPLIKAVQELAERVRDIEA